MPSPLESKAALRLLTYEAEQRALALLSGLRGTPQQILAQLLEAMPELVGYFADGSSTLAADLFDDLRDAADVRRLFRADPVVLDRTQKIRNAVVWAMSGSEESRQTSAQRLAHIAQQEVARPYRDTILQNSHRDPESVGWKRITSPGACGFCRMLAHRGAVYRRDTAQFAAHWPECHCTAAPVFRGGVLGPEASGFQYLASGRSKSARQRAALRDYIATVFPDEDE